MRDLAFNYYPLYFALGLWAGLNAPDLLPKLIELGGSSATLAKHNFDRYWRNARTHTVHDPVRWKYRAVGDYWLNGINPPRHGAI